MENKTTNRAKISNERGMKARLQYLQHLYYFSKKAQGPEEMSLSLKHQNSSKPLKKLVILIALQFRYTFYRPQTKRLRARKIGLPYKQVTQHFVPRSPFGRQPSVTLRATFRAPARIWLAVIDFQNGEQQSRSGQIRSEEIVYSRFIKIPLD